METNNDNTPKYILLSIDEDGTERRQYNDGSIRNEKGHLLVKPDYDGIRTITNDNAHEYLKRRKEKILESIEKSVMDVTRTRLPADAIGAIVGKRAEIAMTDDTRVGNDAAKIVLQAIDAYQNRVTESNTNVSTSVLIDDNTRALLETIARSRMADDDTDIIDI